MSCPIKAYSNTIELTMHTSCYCVLDLLCVIGNKDENLIKNDSIKSQLDVEREIVL